jgi:hypothetical protein
LPPKGFFLPRCGMDVFDYYTTSALLCFVCLFLMTSGFDPSLVFEEEGHQVITNYVSIISFVIPYICETYVRTQLTLTYRFKSTISLVVEQPLA